MYGMDFEREMVRQRTRSYADEAARWRLAKLVRGEVPSARSRLARVLFGAAVRLEREATWKAVWERMEAPRHS